MKPFPKLLRWWIAVALLIGLIILRLDVFVALAWQNLGSILLLDSMVRSPTRDERPVHSLQLASDLFRKALVSRPMPNTYRNLGTASILLGQTGEAIDQTRAAVELDSRDDLNYLALGRAYQAAGLWRSLVGAYFQEDYQPETIPSATVANLLVVKGDGYVEQGNLEEASSFYKRALRTFPLTSGFLGLARLYVLQGQVAEALRTYQMGLIFAGASLKADVVEGYYRLLAQATEERSDAPLVAGMSKDYFLGESFWKGGLPEPTVQALERALSRPDRLSARQQSRAHFILGLYHERTGDMENAVMHYEEATKLDLRVVDASIHLANIYERTGRVEQSVRVAKLVGDLSPEADVDDAGPGLRLLGFDIDPTEMDLGPLITVTLYWQPKEDIAPPGLDGLRYGGRLVQVVTARNLAANGGFDWLDPQGKTLGVGDLYARNEYSPIVTRPTSLESRAIALPAPPNPPSGIHTPPIKLRRGKSYLLGITHYGDARAPMRIGCLWGGYTAQKREAYYGAENARGAWTTTGGIFRVPLDAPSDTCEIWLLNAGQYDLEFDNLALIELPSVLDDGPMARTGGTTKGQ